MSEPETEDPWIWLHDNDFSWDDVNAISAVLWDGGFEVVPAESGLREALTPEWLGGGYFCIVCEKSSVGNVKPEAWAGRRENIRHTDSCPLRVVAVLRPPAVDWPKR